MAQATTGSLNGGAAGGEPRVEIHPERPSRPAAGGAFHLLTSVTAPEIANPDRSRPPLDLAFVVDRSGSMAGGKLDLVKRGVEHALRMLDDRDTLSVTIYDDRIEVLTPQSRFSHETHDDALRRLRPIAPRGSTDLTGGWLTGCDQLARVADGSSELRRREGTPLCRALLLTDGLANVGIVDPDEIAGHAEQLRRRGIATSSFGVGDSFDELLLGRMADAGGGRYHYIASAADVPRVFAGELGELLAVALRDVSVSLRVPAGWQASLLNDLPIQRDGDWLRVSLGELSSREDRSLIWEATLPEGFEGQVEQIEMRLRWQNPAGDRTIEHVTSYRIEARREQGEPDEAVLDELARIYGSRARAEALTFNRAGRFADAREVVQSYAARMPATSVGVAMADELAEEVAPMSAPMAQADMKQRHFRSRSIARQQKDYTSER